MIKTYKKTIPLLVIVAMLIIPLIGCGPDMNRLEVVAGEAIDKLNPAYPNIPVELQATNVSITSKVKCESITPGISDPSGQGDYTEAWIISFTYDIGNNGVFQSAEGRVSMSDRLWIPELIPSCP